MKFSFSVGDQEKHAITYNFNQLWGKLAVEVDGKNILETVQMLKSPLSTKQTTTFEVGDKEKHNIKIDKNMSPLFAGFFPCKYEVFVDEKLVNTYNGY